jgi:hypothetical protein
MATHSRKVDPALSSGMYQVFTNDTSITGAVTFATGDYIDFLVTLNRPARHVHIMLKGAVDVTLLFNTRLVQSKFKESEANETITMPESMGNIVPFRIFAAAGEEAFFETPEGFMLTDLKLVAYSGVASASTNLTIIAF